MSSTVAGSLVVTAVAAALLASPMRAAADAAWLVQAEAGPGVDSNALRVAGAGQAPGAVYSGGALKAQLRAWGEGWLLDGRLFEGLRLFAGQPGANLLASRVDVTARRWIAEAVQVGFDAVARDLSERGGVRDEDELAGFGRIGFSRGPLRLDGSAGWSLSAPRAADLRLFRRDGPGASIAATVQVAREHHVSARYSLDAWAYRAWLEGDRSDREHTAALEWTWDGPVLASLAYAYAYNASTYGAGTWRRHRVTAKLACDVPGGFDLAARVTVQRSRHPGGVILAEELLVREGDESQNAFEAQLTRPITPRLDVALKAAHYRSELGAGASLAFRRTVAQVALAWSTGG